MKGFMNASGAGENEDIARANRIGNRVAGIFIGFFAIVLIVIVVL